MCSFLMLICRADNYPDEEVIIEANEYMKSRGPDMTHTQCLTDGSLKMLTVHNLLDISGSAVRQPLNNLSSDSLLFNGEIYAPTDGTTPDTALLNQMFVERRLGALLKSCRGEYAIATCSMAEGRLDMYTDLIGTKPLFFAIEEGRVAVASYSNVLARLGFKEIRSVAPNRHISCDIADIDRVVVKTERLQTLKLEQHVEDETLWARAFVKSVGERASHFSSKVFVPLSAGYDSGAICCALNQLGIPYVTVTLGDAENKKVMKRRIQINARHSCTEHICLPALDKEDIAEMKEEILSLLGRVKYHHIDEGRKEPICVHEDSGSIGLAVVCKEMKKRGFNTLLSGSGADEIISDYGFGGNKIYAHSQFGGLFPECLDGFFPWKKFYGDTQRSYLIKDEMITGLNGIEGRYPYLDKEVVQEFLSLSQELKNKRYKHCIASYLDKAGYPYEAGKKDGFNPAKTRFSLVHRIANKIGRIVKSR